MDLIRLVVTLALLPSRIQESRVAAKVFLRFYFLRLIRHISSQNEVRPGLNPKRGRETALRPRPASTCRCSSLHLALEMESRGRVEFRGKFSLVGEGEALEQKHTPARGINLLY